MNNQGGDRHRVMLLHPVMETGRLDYHLIMPMGFFSMAHRLQAEGFEAEIVNPAVERRLDPGFDIASVGGGRSPLVVAMDLHWYLHSHAAVETARRLAQSNPGLRILLGGYTAGFFADEILERYDFIDAVVAGEGETPLVEYVRAAAGHGDLSRVPNLVYREGGGVTANPQRWTASAHDMESMRFAELELMRNWDTYLKICQASPVMSYANTPEPLDHVFYLETGRGCSLNCPYCGGAATSSAMLTGRGSPGFRSVEAVLDDIRRLRRFGVRNLYLEYDPYPMSEEFYPRLFQAMAQEGLEFGINFGAWHMPGDEFLAAFDAVAVKPQSGIVLSPDTGCEELRRRIKGGRFYANDELIRWAEKVRDMGHFPTVCFAVGLPFETRRDFDRTLELIKTLMRNNINVTAYGFKLEPGSPVFLEPERFGFELYRKTFHDYYEHTRLLTLGAPTPHPLGYRTAEFSEQEILGLQVKALRTATLGTGFLNRRAARPGVLNAGSLAALAGVVLGSNRLIQKALRE